MLLTIFSLVGSQYSFASTESYELISNSDIGSVVVYQQTRPLTYVDEGIGNGYCVDLVRYYRDIPWSGDAKYWYDLAVAYEYDVGSIPQNNAIWVTEGGKHGHVAFVIAVREDSFDVIEQNVTGRWRISIRTIKLEDNMLFIY